jgi:hypothetical protein
VPITFLIQQPVLIFREMAPGCWHVQMAVPGHLQQMIEMLSAASIAELILVQDTPAAST